MGLSGKIEPPTRKILQAQIAVRVDLRVGEVRLCQMRARRRGEQIAASR